MITSSGVTESGSMTAVSAIDSIVSLSGSIPVMSTSAERMMLAVYAAVKRATFAGASL